MEVGDGAGAVHLRGVQKLRSLDSRLMALLVLVAAVVVLVVLLVVV